jgi:hypothetical protein
MTALGKTRFKTAFSALATALLLGALAACAGASAASPPAAAVNAQDVARSLAALIADIHSTQDISRANVRKHFGPLNPRYYARGIVGKLTEPWYYSVEIYIVPGAESVSLHFGFSDQSHKNADIGPVCVPFEDFARPLTAAGFTVKPPPPVTQESRSALPWGPGGPDLRLATSLTGSFSRGSVGGTVYVKVDDLRACVRMVDVYADLKP